MAFDYPRCHRRTGHASGIQSLGIFVSLEEPRKEGWKPSLDALDAIVADDINRVNRLIVEKMESRAPLIPQLAGHVCRRRQTAPADADVGGIASLRLRRRSAHRARHVRRIYSYSDIAAR